jgi:hypothetical protein
MLQSTCSEFVGRFLSYAEDHKKYFDSGSEFSTEISAPYIGQIQSTAALALGMA